MFGKIRNIYRQQILPARKCSKFKSLSLFDRPVSAAGVVRLAGLCHLSRCEGELHLGCLRPSGEVELNSVFESINRLAANRDEELPVGTSSSSE